MFAGDATFGERSREAVRRCLGEGSVLACEIVWAEVAAFFPDATAARAAMDRLQVGFSPLDRETALAAGLAFGEYRRAGGIRKRMIADFLIGAHASATADRLLTRDRGFGRQYFRGLTLIDPRSR